MERLLHYVWRHRLFPLEAMHTTEGEAVEVIDPGLHNADAGPDFFNAKVRIGGTVWVGNVEIHLRSSDWVRHGHHTDTAYNSIILHVAETVDTDVVTADGKRPPQLQLPIPESLRADYATLCRTEDYPRCWPIISKLSRLTTHSWLSALLAERLHERAALVTERLRLTDGDWERAFFITLARNFGFGINGEAFEYWARHLPLHAAAKHRDDAFQLEALFLGTAGLLTEAAIPPTAREAAAGDAYLQRLRREWAFLAHKFQLPEPMEPTRWRYLRLRPQNFPHLRIVQLAQLYARRTAGLHQILEARDSAALHDCFATGVSTYWQDHYLFGLTSEHKDKTLSTASRDLIIINTVVPTLYAYGQEHHDESLQERAVELLESLRAEKNFIMRQWEMCGLSVETAADSQALIQLKREYCDRLDCLRCRFGYEYLKSPKSPLPTSPCRGGEP